MQIVQICTFFFPVPAKSVVVPSFEGQNWPIFYKISIYVITCAKLHKYGLNGGWDLWCWWWWWGISQENDDFQAEPWHLLQGAKVDCYNFTPTQPHDDGDDSHIIIMLILIRDTKSQNFPVGKNSRAKTFQTECVNRFCDINAPKKRKSLSRHTFAKSA